ncbi:MAG: hypothetical protein LC670_06700, partial [Flavobacteriales bacterium]|nr:hypothetical protein [Flavobacteriales bacterium]
MLSTAFYNICRLILFYTVMRRILPGFFFFTAALIIMGSALTGCRDDDFNSSPDFRLSFSVDTVLFDTVFSTIGSATRLVKVYNRESDPVRISRIDLDNDPNNSYRLNFDGLPGTEFTDIEIRGEDSLFFFVEVTVNPDGDELYPFVDGAIRFTVNNNTQTLPLVAWGWDAIFYPRSIDSVRVESGLPPFYTIS